MSDTTHPEWLAVGSRVEVVRTFGFGREVVTRYTATVVRHTKTTVVLDDGTRFRRRATCYEMTPAYLDYRTVLGPGGSDERHDDPH